MPGNIGMIVLVARENRRYLQVGSVSAIALAGTRRLLLGFPQPRCTRLA